MRDQVYQIVLMAIDEVNEQVPADMRLSAEDDCPFLGAERILDSLGVVEFMNAVEHIFNREFKTVFSFTDIPDDHWARFRTMGDLRLYLIEYLTEREKA